MNVVFAVLLNSLPVVFHLVLLVNIRNITRHLTKPILVVPVHIRSKRGLILHLVHVWRIDPDMSFDGRIWTWKPALIMVSYVSLWKNSLLSSQITLYVWSWVYQTFLKLKQIKQISEIRLWAFYYLTVKMYNRKQDQSVFYKNKHQITTSHINTRWGKLD